MLHLGDAIFELGAVRFSVARNSSSAFSDCLTAPSAGSPSASPSHVPAHASRQARSQRASASFATSKLGLGASHFGATLLRLLPQRGELGLGG